MTDPATGFALAMKVALFWLGVFSLAMGIRYETRSAEIIDFATYKAAKTKTRRVPQP